MDNVIRCGSCLYAEYYTAAGFCSQEQFNCSQFDIQDVNPDTDGCTFGQCGNPAFRPPDITVEVEVW